MRRSFAGSTAELNIAGFATAKTRMGGMGDMGWKGKEARHRIQ
jgi:hypothetical protein